MEETMENQVPERKLPDPDEMYTRLEARLMSFMRLF